MLVNINSSIRDLMSGLFKLVAFITHEAIHSWYDREQHAVSNNWCKHRDAAC